MSNVEILISEEKGVRKLHFGSEWVQGAMRISRPLHLELEYTRELLACLLLTEPSSWPRRILCIGLGVGALPKFFNSYLPHSTVDVIEICPSVVVVCQQHFKLPASSDRFKVHIACGAEFVENCQQKYDLIVVDGFDEDARVGPLDSSEFFNNARICLSSTGVLATNVLAHNQNPMMTIERLAAAFDNRALGLPPCYSGNVIGLAFQGNFDWPDEHLIKSNQMKLESLTQTNFSRLTSKLLALPSV